MAGGNWSFSTCSLEGVCNDSMNVLTRAECNTLGGQFAYATDVIRCEDAGGHWTGNNTNRGQIITNLCMNCHRQETGGLPYDAVNPARPSRSVRTTARCRSSRIRTPTSS